jgi:adenylate cyclase, class 2
MCMLTFFYFYTMKIINYEFKAKANHITDLENKLLSLNPQFIGTDHQIDTYYNVAQGRLKLREGNIENSLIHYERSDFASAKQSSIILYQHHPNNSLKQILEKVHGVKVVVDKKRKIYFIDNVKFHFDTVDQLGTYVEVEAIDKDGSYSIEKLKEQCDYYANFFNIQEQDFISQSYSDLLLAID